MSSPNILLLVLDSVRARNMNLYGHPRENTPFLNQFSSEAVVYQHAHAPSIHSIASHASIWTGFEAEQHNMVRHEDKLKPNVTIWEYLEKNDYETGLFTKNTVIAHASNLAAQFGTTVTNEFQDTGDKIFDDAHGPKDNRNHEGLIGNLKRAIEDDSPLKALINNGYHAYLRSKKDEDSIDSYDLIDNFISWQSETEGPWAACINLMDAHYPYEPSDEFDHWGDEKLWQYQSELDKPPSYEYTHDRPWWELSALENLYDGAILEMDSIIEGMVGRLENENILDDTLVVITSDHGEGFGERSRANPKTRIVTHSWGVHEVLTHVPLIVRYPDSKVSGEIMEPTSLTVFPQAVKDVIGDKITGEAFLTDSPVVSSTHRLREEDRLIFDDSVLDADDYVGPWRAVYEYDGENVVKQIRRGKETATVKIRDAQISYPISDYNENIKEYYEKLEQEQVKVDSETTKPVQSDVEDRLSDLGYIR